MASAVADKEKESGADIMRHVRIGAEEDGYLTGQESAIKQGGAWRPQQAPIIRGILRGIAQAGLDLTTATSEDEVAALVEGAIKPSKRTKE